MSERDRAEQRARLPRTPRYNTVQATEDHAYTLSELRVAAMQESLEALGRFDPLRARSRFLEHFDPQRTVCLLVDNEQTGQELAGFYVLLEAKEFFWLDHFYIHPDNQSLGLGSSVLAQLTAHCRSMRKPLRLKALKGSRSNQFYQRNGLQRLSEEQWDIIYEAPVAPAQTSPH